MTPPGVNIYFIKKMFIGFLSDTNNFTTYRRRKYKSFPAW